MEVRPRHSCIQAAPVKPGCRVAEWLHTGVRLLEFLTRELLDGDAKTLFDDVDHSLGRPTHDFVRYARETAATGI